MFPLHADFVYPLFGHIPGGMIQQEQPVKETLKRFLLLSLALGFMAFLSAGCQTTKGFGEDVEELGENIQGK